MHVAGHAGDVQRLAAVVALDDRDHLGRGVGVVHQTTHLQRGLQAKRDFGLHVGKFLLEQLCLRQRLVELFAVQTVLTRGVPAEFSGPQCAPADAIAGAVKTAERAFQTFDMGQQGIFADFDVIHHDLACDRRAQRQFVADFWRGQTLHAFFKDKAADLAAVLFGLGPDHEDIRDRRVRDPHFRAGQLVAVGGFHRTGFHARRVGARIGFCQTKAADEFAAGQFGKILHALLFRAIGVDRVHDEAGLHGHHRPIAAVHAFHFARNQTVRHIIAAQAAVLFGHGDTQKAHVAHLAEDRGVGGFIGKSVDHAGLQLFLRIGARAFLDHAFVFGQLFVQAERIRPIKAAHVGGVFGFQYGQFVAHGMSSSGFGFGRSIAKPGGNDYRWILLNL